MTRQTTVVVGIARACFPGSLRRAVASGVYFYRLEVGGEVLTKRMVLLK